MNDMEELREAVTMEILKELAATGKIDEETYRCAHQARDLPHQTQQDPQCHRAVPREPPKAFSEI